MSVALFSLQRLNIGALGWPLGGLGLPGLLPRLGGALGGIGIRLRLPEAAESEPSKLAEGILKAAPKKKVSYRRRRQRQLASDKKVNELNNLNRCPACGHYKRAHTLCMKCAGEIKKLWALNDKKTADAARDPASIYSEEGLSETDKNILYPGKRESEYERKLKDKAEYLYKRPLTLPVRPRKS